MSEGGGGGELVLELPFSLCECVCYFLPPIRQNLRNLVFALRKEIVVMTIVELAGPERELLVGKQCLWWFYGERTL